jgi:hypothetical protein
MTKEQELKDIEERMRKVGLKLMAEDALRSKRSGSRFWMWLNEIKLWYTHYKIKRLIRKTNEELIHRLNRRNKC